MSDYEAAQSSTIPPCVDPASTMTFLESSFFRQTPPPVLPTPAEIRAINEKSSVVITFNRPPPVILPSLGLVVKYGADVTVAEAQTIIMVREKLQHRVPVPEIFGWTEEGGQTFIYMSLIEGQTVQERWPSLDEAARLSVCQELKRMVEAWRALPQGGQKYIGSVGSLPLNDIHVVDRPELVGPWVGEDAVERFQNACGIDINTPCSIKFTHNDLVAPNIMLSRGPNPTVTAIIDWGQSGWYPAYWEYCKGRRVEIHPDYFPRELQQEWREKYLPRVLESVDDETHYHPWLYFVLSKGM